MYPANCRSIGVSALGLALLLWIPSAVSQWNAAISETMLREPWDQQLAVVQSLSGSITAVSGAQARADLADTLATLQVSIGEFERQVDQVIERLAGDPQFAYVAAETSQALAVQLADVHAQFETLYTALAVQQRDDVRTAQASLTALQEMLQQKRHFDRDVVTALGSGSRQQIVELATRWWNGEQRAIEVRKVVASLREELDGIVD